MSKYTATAKDLAGRFPKESHDEVSAEIEKAIVDAVKAEREACALILARLAAERLSICRPWDSSYWVFLRQSDLLKKAANSIRSRGDV